MDIRDLRCIVTSFGYKHRLEAALAHDLVRVTIALRSILLRAATTQHQFDALVSFAYNAGLKHLRTSTFLAKHLACDHLGAMMEFANWVHGGGKVLARLVERKKAEAALYGS